MVVAPGGRGGDCGAAWSGVDGVGGGDSSGAACGVVDGVGGGGDGSGVECGSVDGVGGGGCNVMVNKLKRDRRELRGRERNGDWTTIGAATTQPSD